MSRQKSCSRSLSRGFNTTMARWRSKLKPGKELELIAEPDNPHDPDAVAIYRKGVHLGYVPGDGNATIAQLLRFGHANVLECRIMQVDKKADPWKQVRVGIYVTDNRKQKRAE